MAFSLAGSIKSSFPDGRCNRSREEGRGTGDWPVKGRAVDLELEVVGLAFRWETGCKPGRKGSDMAFQEISLSLDSMHIRQRRARASTLLINNEVSSLVVTAKLDELSSRSGY